MPSLVGPALAPGSLAHLTQPVLDLGDLVLRPWRSTDLPAVLAAYADPDIQRWHARSMTEAEARSWIEAWPRRWSGETGVGWAIATEAAVLGQISLRRLDFQEGLADISYWVLPGARGRRVARRALSALSDWAFGTLGLNRIEVMHSTGNPRSCRVATNAGYRLEGTKRQEAKHADGWHDMHLHARLRGDHP